ncbi:MAG: hypothetical protein LBK50_03820 [Candidatus Nomurabacteria bacterium]|jgi:hypothetical protein|nr:hypothetical protein [Candidatus Nomurabacteria bacterium]
MEISARKIFEALVLVSLIFFIVHVALLSINYADPYWYEAIELFNMDREISLPTWYNQLLFVALAAILGAICVAKKRGGDRWWKYWAALSVGMVFLSADEGAMIHEKIDILAQLTGLKWFLVSVGGPVFTYSWWVIVLVVLVAAGLVCWRFFNTLPKRTLQLLLAAVAVFLFGAVGLEAYASWYNSIDASYYVSHFITGLEETCEMLGLSIAIYTFLDYARSLPASLWRKVKFSIEQ